MGDNKLAEELTKITYPRLAVVMWLSSGCPEDDDLCFPPKIVCTCAWVSKAGREDAVLLSRNYYPSVNGQKEMVGDSFTLPKELIMNMAYMPPPTAMMTTMKRKPSEEAAKQN